MLVNVLKAEGDDVTRAMSKGCVLVNVFTPLRRITAKRTEIFVLVYFVSCIVYCLGYRPRPGRKSYKMPMCGDTPR